MTKSNRLIKAEEIIVGLSKTRLTDNPEKNKLIYAAQDYKKEYLDKKYHEIEVWIANNNHLLLVEYPDIGLRPIVLKTTFVQRNSIVRDIKEKLTGVIIPPGDMPMFGLGQLFTSVKDKSIRSFVMYAGNKDRPFVNGFEHYQWTTPRMINEMFQKDTLRLRNAQRALVYNNGLPYTFR